MSKQPTEEISKEKKPRRFKRWGRYTRAFRRSHDKARNELQETLPLLQHLDELRRRVGRAMVALVITTLMSFAFSSQLVDYFTIPIGGRDTLVSIEITENIAIFMRVSLLSGLVLGMPFVAYQAIRFILPGLERRERLLLFLGVPFASILFTAGVAFAWFVMIPVAVPFLMSFMGIHTQPRPLNYFEFITSLMLWIGLSFEMPLVAMILARLKIITARQLVVGWRYALVIIAIIAAVVTPTIDPVNMGLVMLPLAGLYLISILLAAIAGRD